MLKKTVDEFIEGHPWLCRLVRDKDFRTVLTAFSGLSLNILFAVFNGAVGWRSHSPWFGTLAAYYILLAAMRYGWLSQNGMLPGFRKKEKAPKSERKLCTLYGFLFCFMAVVLAGAVILLINLEGGKVYADLVIYAGAAYAFFKITLAAINMVRARKKRSLSWMILRDIGYVDACVSILTLQIALLSAFSIRQEEFLEKTVP